MIDSSRIGILGGTFDPIHQGHVAVAELALEALALARVLFIPAGVPPHRSAPPMASSFHRFAMVALALADRPRFVVSDLELRVAQPSYTADTLQQLASTGYTPTQLFFITGTDAFAEIASWHRYPELLDQAHFVVVSRPQYQLEEPGSRFPRLRGRIHDLGDRRPAAPAFTPGTPALNRPAILMLRALTPDVSSRQVRRRLKTGESIAGLVPPGVEAYIRRQGLYGAPPGGK